MASRVEPMAARRPQIEDLLGAQSTRRRGVRIPRILIVLLVLAVPVLAVAAAGAFGTGYFFEPLPVARALAVDIPTDGEELKKFMSRERHNAATMQAQLQKLTPVGTYIVIDTAQNRLSLWKEGRMYLDAICSAGSGHVLKENGGKNRQWVFDTPRGQFKVTQRLQDPVWKKPDWAFVEDGKPPVKAEDYYETGTLGEYALFLEDGYMIHGTLYERLLGRSVSHGCVRLGKEDLRRVWADTKYGTLVYIH